MRCSNSAYSMDTTLNRFENALTSTENIFSFVSTGPQITVPQD
jgi:hypothetical protein